jgi:hypothetical protein
MELLRSIEEDVSMAITLSDTAKVDVILSATSETIGQYLTAADDWEREKMPSAALEKFQRGVWTLEGRLALDDPLGVLLVVQCRLVMRTHARVSATRPST